MQRGMAKMDGLFPPRDGFRTHRRPTLGGTESYPGSWKITVFLFEVRVVFQNLLLILKPHGVAAQEFCQR